MSNKTQRHHDGRRVEDLRLITGAGRYASDWNARGQLYGHFVRSDRAHAEIAQRDFERRPGCRPPMGTAQASGRK